MARVFQHFCVWQTRTMKVRKPTNYLRSYRQRWGFSQGELAHLLGWGQSDVISRVERKQRPPTLNLAIACFILFGTPAAELFPAISANVEAGVMSRVWEMYHTIQGDPSPRKKRKIQLFEDAIKRAEQRNRASTL